MLSFYAISRAQLAPTVKSRDLEIPPTEELKNPKSVGTPLVDANERVNRNVQVILKFTTNTLYFIEKSVDDIRVTW